MTVKQLELRLPVREKPGSLDGLVGSPAKRLVPQGEELAADFAALPDRHPKLASHKLEAAGAKLVGRLACPKRWAACDDVTVSATKGGSEVASGELARVGGGKDKQLKLELTRRGRKLVRNHSKTKLKVEITALELSKAVKQKAKAVR